VDTLVAPMEDLLVPLRDHGDERQHFRATYLRTTKVVAAELTVAASTTRPGWNAGMPPAVRDFGVQLRPTPVNDNPVKPEEVRNARRS
jgi:hypothetical protein